jgi:pyruvate,water dikinase
MPVVATRYAVDMPALHGEADALWREWTAAGADETTWRRIVAEGADLFRRAQRYQGMATMFVQGAYSALAALVAELGEPGAENTLVAGDAGLDENRMLTSLWSVGRGEVPLASFLAEFGFHGPDEGSVESWSWRERPELLDAVLAAYAGAPDGQAPDRITERVAAAREARLARLLSAADEERAASLQALVAQATGRMTYRELGKATFLRGLDLVRMGARCGGESLARDGVLASADDVWYLTLDELLADPMPVSQAEIDTRRAERDSYRTITVPPVFLGQPDPVPVPESDGTAAGAGATVTGMGASPGVVKGTIRVVSSPAEPIDEGDIVVTAVTDPSWVPLFLVAGAIVVDVGGALSHAAIVARELALPCVIGTVDGSRRLRTGDRVVVDGTAGTVQVVGSVSP